MTEEKNEAIEIKANVYEIDGVFYRVTAEFKNEIDLRQTVYRCALDKAIDEIKKTA